MSEWNFMDAASRDNVMTAWREESDTFFDLVGGSGWEDQTACSLWQVRDVVGHLVDTTEAYFVSFDAARGQSEAPDALGLPDMARHVDEGAKVARGVPQDELLDRLRDDRERMVKIAEGLTDDEWSGLMVPHKYMGPLPACFYPIFQVVDYTVHGWDVPQGAERGHVMRGESADLLVPLCLVLWQATADVPADTPSYALGIRITTGQNAGDTRAEVSADGLTLEPGPIDDLPAIIEFDPASFVLTAYGRVNGGTVRGDREVATRFLDLFFRI